MPKEKQPRVYWDRTANINLQRDVETRVGQIKEVYFGECLTGKRGLEESPVQGLNLEIGYSQRGSRAGTAMLSYSDRGEIQRILHEFQGDHGQDMDPHEIMRGHFIYLRVKSSNGHVLGFSVPAH